ncbi:Inner nuclear membrane protein MAN1 domain-containing protein [Rozella allomycis CSF55]|uniref:Inner nuclear membrane protein MAN1 domain-containing protein n=1 Tax=Rozella allomycis (strain CSF55) TaxID=988480 RepID=A0A075AXW4_ROZAC|nr:Inner nuclear membrane protein MAN1 domain-containing protein [Rozella allomycis CSF55]|eukprot:EPZ35125.1 Inner nuclear membrane protein MAN1 domain-containing protein [Rozella allomycis CSF55]
MDLPPFLQEGYKPSSKTKSELVSILNANGENANMQMKKQELIDLFESTIVANREKLIQERLNIKPSKEGIKRIHTMTTPPTKSTKRQEKEEPIENFSNDNPFQSGSENEIELISPRRRRTRKTIVETPKNEEEPLLKKVLKSPQAKGKKRIVEDSLTSNNEDSENPILLQSPFGPIKTKEIKYQELGMHKPEKIKRKSTFCGLILRILIFVAFFSSIGTFFYFKVVSPFPFCEERINPNLIEILNRKCIPCPKRGTCKDSTLTCEIGYHEYSPIYTLRKYCAPDKNEQLLIEKVSSIVEQELGLIAGKDYCESRSTTMLSEKEILKIVKEKFKLKVSMKNLVAYVSKALDSPNIESVNKNGLIFYYSIVKVQPLKCLLNQYLLENSSYIITFVGVTILLSLIYFRHTNRKRQTERVNSYVKEILFLLAQQDEAHRQDHRVEPMIAINQFRDHLLIAKHDWDLVVKQVSGNTGVKTSTANIKGEVNMIWQWIGAHVFSPTKNK